MTVTAFSGAKELKNLENLENLGFLQVCSKEKQVLIYIDQARTYLQPHYGNGVFGNVYLSAGQH
jgi:hypothetical protein